MKKKSISGRGPLSYSPWLKRLLIMKMIVILLLVVGLTSSFAESDAQTAKLNLKLRGGTVKDVIEEIERQTDLSFMYDNNVFRVDRIISINAENETVKSVVEKLISGQNLKYEMVNRYIVITSNAIPSAIQQQKSVSGKVTDSSGQPLPGVSVVIKGTTNGTITDGNGNYSLSNVPENAVLQFSFVGMKAQEIAVGGKTSINVTLTEDAIGIEEVVAIGYGSVKKSDLTGSVSSVSSDELTSVSVSSVEQMMQGRAAGVQITSSSGGPGASSSVKIRGVNSINSSSEPLYVIDGVPVAANSAGDVSASGTSGNTGFSILSTMNPGDIESIEVLKDASSTAIYGSRGANGVILITTKKGRTGKSKIELIANYGVSVLPSSFDVLSGNDFITKFNEFAVIDGITPIPTDGSIPLEDINWIDEVTQNGITQNYQLSVNGGDERTQYYFSGSYYDQQGLIKESFLRRYSSRFNGEHKPMNGVKIGASFAYTRSEHALTENNRIINNAASFAPVIPRTNPGGEVYYPSFEYLNNGQIYSFNPLGDIYGAERGNFNDRILLNSYINLDITKALTFKSTIGVDLINSMNQEYKNTLTAGGINTNGSASVRQQRTNTLININQLTYQKLFGAHNFSATAIHETTKAGTQTFVNAWADFPTDALSYYGIGTGTNKQGVDNTIREWTMMSFAGRINYNYGSKYLITFTARKDGSSRFGSGNKWGFFPSGALAWRVSEESFMKSIPAISNLKIRTSYGVTGNTDIGFYNSIVTIGTGSDYSSGMQQVNYYYPQRIANKDLKWETTKQLNFGADLGFFNNRLMLIADYFNSFTNDLLLAVNIAENSGYSTILKNAGSVENKGIELSLEVVPIEKKNLQWSISSTFSRSINKVTNLGGQHEIGVGGQKLYVGQPLQNQWGYIETGIFQSEEEILANPSRPNDEPGVPSYQDVNLDGKIDGNDMVVLGRGFPDFYYGLTSNLTYENFDLFIYFSGVEGITVYNYSKALLVGDGATNTLQEYFDNRWTPENPSLEYPRAKPQMAGQSTRFMEDASFLRLKTLTLGYRLPVQNVSWISNARFFITGQNLFTFTRYSGYDPEVNSAGQSNVAPPVDDGAYPRSRTFSLGINLSF